MDINKAKRIIIKIGSSLIAGEDNKGLKQEWLKSLIEDVAALKNKGKDVIIVSSGAVALGRKYINAHKKFLKLEEKQAAAACGQTELVEHYRKYLAKHKIAVAQILVTIQDSENRRRYLNARNTLNTLLDSNIIPIINENDTVATNELRFGDNDRLAARIAQMVSADLLILLSDIDGLYSSNPRLDRNAKHIERVENIDGSVKDMAGAALSAVGSGGMITKIAAAEMAVESGCSMIIANGQINNPIKNIQKGGKKTFFAAKDSPVCARKRWIASSLNVHGEIIIDSGAVLALTKGNSLLPAGVVDIKGRFARGDAVAIKDHKLKEIGRGLVAYSSKDAKLIMGQHSSDIEHITGFAGRDELIHRDDLILFEK